MIEQQLPNWRLLSAGKGFPGVNGAFCSMGEPAYHFATWNFTQLGSRSRTMSLVASTSIWNLAKRITYSKRLTESLAEQGLESTSPGEIVNTGPWLQCWVQCTKWCPFCLTGRFQCWGWQRGVPRLSASSATRVPEAGFYGRHGREGWVTLPQILLADSSLVIIFISLYFHFVGLNDLTFWCCSPL